MTKRKIRKVYLKTPTGSVEVNMMDLQIGDIFRTQGSKYWNIALSLPERTPGTEDGVMLTAERIK